LLADAAGGLVDMAGWAPRGALAAAADANFSYIITGGMPCTICRYLPCLLHLCALSPCACYRDMVLCHHYSHFLLSYVALRAVPPPPPKPYGA